jgi:OOP family OmpA-OmpF porin
MSRTKEKLLMTSLITLGLVFGGSAAAQMKGTLLDRDGKTVTDGFGECVSVDKMKHWHKDHKYYCAEEKAKPKPKPKPQPVAETVTIGAHALFDHDKSNLRPEGKSELDAVAAKLKSFSSVQSISVVGHTDSDGTEAYNQALSERRAASVKDYLVSKGISSSVISTSGMGETQPTASNKTKEGRQQNRRVEITIRATK